MTDIKAIIFDLGRVLVDVDLTKGFFRHTPEGKAQSEKQILDKLMQDNLYREYACGRVAVEEFHAELCKRLNLDFDFASFKKEWNSVFMPIEGMSELVYSLARNYKIGLLSDIGPLHWEYLLENLPVLKTIGKPTLSYKIGFLKPESKAYGIAAENVSTKPEQCLFIDDREINVQGAQKAGMSAIHFTGYSGLKRDLQEYNLYPLYGQSKIK